MRTFLLGAALALVTLSGCAKAKEKPPGPHDPMTLDEVEAAVNAKQAQAVDCNDDETRKELGVVPGAILLSHYELYPVSELPPDKNTKLIFYCFDLG